MTNKPKIIGTQFESATVNYLKAHGFEKARRVVQKGSLDEGDVFVCENMIVQCKGGHYAEDASDQQLRIWYKEMTQQCDNAGVEVGFLVVKRKGHGIVKAGSWWVIQASDKMLVRFLLGEYVEFLHGIGWTGEGYTDPVVH